MSKDLEKEYKALIEEEASKVDADALWNRIDAALPKKEANVVNIDTRKKWYKNIKTVSYIGTVAAACLLVVLVMPELLRRNKSFEAINSPNATHMNDSAAEMLWESLQEKSDDLASVEFEASEETVTDEVINEAATNSNEPAANKAPSNAENASFAKFVVLDYSDGLFRCEAEYLDEALQPVTEIYIEASEDEMILGEYYEFFLVKKEDENGKTTFEIKK